MRLRHIEQAWVGIRAIGNLGLLHQIGFHVPRLRDLLWSGYVRKAADAVTAMPYQLAGNPNSHTPAVDARLMGKELLEPGVSRKTSSAPPSMAKTVATWCGFLARPCDCATRMEWHGRWTVF